MSGFIRTFTGKNFYPFIPEPQVICLEDIAHALSNLCRYAGHVPKFYSVAQHSVHVAQVLKGRGYSKQIQLVGLLHDAPEAYIIDLPAPIKVELAEYRKLEEGVWQAVVEHFSLDLEGGTMYAVDQADQDVFAMEARDLMGSPIEWQARIRHCRPEPMIISPQTSEFAEASFLGLFAALTKKKVVKLIEETEAV